MSELSPEQIVAIGSAVAAIIATLIMAARRSAMGAAPSEQPGAPANPYLLLDARQVEALIAAIGQSAATASEARRALERNTETAKEVAQEAERLSRDMRELGDRIARNMRN